MPNCFFNCIPYLSFIEKLCEYFDQILMNIYSECENQENYGIGRRQLSVFDVVKILK